MMNIGSFVTKLHVLAGCIIATTIFLELIGVSILIVTIGWMVATLAWLAGSLAVHAINVGGETTYEIFGMKIFDPDKMQEADFQLFTWYWILCAFFVPMIIRPITGVTPLWFILFGAMFVAGSLGSYWFVYVTKGKLW